MAKTIKFNLICDQKPVRTIEDLQNNFSIEDVLDYYNNKLLHRWLKVRGYDSELKAVSDITSKDPMEIAKKLISIFDVSTDNKKVEEDIYMLKYLEEREKRCSIYHRENYKAKKIIEDYEAGYLQLVDNILKNPNDVAIIKASLAEITSNYAWILELDHRTLFWNFREKSILAVMCLLMNEKSRNYYLPVKTTDENGKITWDIEENKDKNDMFDSICAMTRRTDLATTLKENLISFSGVTDGYWKDLKPKGKRYMIVSMDDGDYVRSSGHSGGDLSHGDILNEFRILDGIDYKSNYNTHELLYMEV